jgi:hypothetical protein
VALPRYTFEQQQVDAFKITGIDVPDIGALLHGPDGIEHPVRARYLDDHEPYVGGYYIRFDSGQESFMDADVFEVNFRRVSES